MFGIEVLPAELQGIGYTMIVLMVVAIVQFVMLFFIWWLTRGVLGPFIKAKLRGRSVLINLRKDKKLMFEDVQNEAGMYKGRLGYHMISPETVYLAPNSVPASIGYEMTGSTLNPKHILFLQKLKDGMDLELPKMVKSEKTRKETPVRDNNGKVILEKQFVKINDIDDLQAISDKLKVVGMELLLHYGGETLRVQDIVNFFLYDNNPSLIDSKIENRLAKEMEGERKLPVKAIMIMIPLVLVLVIGYMVISNYMSSQGYQDKWATCTSQLASCQASQKVITQPNSTSGGSTSTGGTSGIS